METDEQSPLTNDCGWKRAQKKRPGDKMANDENPLSIVAWEIAAYAGRCVLRQVAMSLPVVWLRIPIRRG